jgi:serine/threonine-protein kinase SRPK3
MGKFPMKFSQRCAKSKVNHYFDEKRYFNKDGSLRRIPMLNCWSLKNVLVEKYKFKREEA